MEIQEIPRTFSMLVTEQELTALTEAVESWIDNSTGEEPAAETLSGMYQQLRDALEEDALEEEGVEEEGVEEEGVEEEAVEEEAVEEEE